MGGPRLDVDEINRRVILTVDWLTGNEETAQMRLGLYGASTGAAAALAAAVGRPQAIGAVVSRGGRPDLVSDMLHLVRTLTLFIAGERDSTVLSISREAMARMKAETELEIVAAASHLFEEPGALEKVSALSRDWFTRYLT